MSRHDVPHFTFDPRSRLYLTRRTFLKSAAFAALAAACGGDDDVAVEPTGTSAPSPTTTFTEPSTQLSGELRILLWSHFVPRHDEWFDGFAQEWGDSVGVNVTVDHIAVADVPARIAAEIQSGSGHDLMQYIAPLPQFEQSVVDLADVTEEAESRFGAQNDVCRNSSFNPTTGKFYAYAPGWVPDPGDYRKSLWETAGFPDGPSTWDELLEGGSSIRADQGVQMGIGMSQEIDSNMAARAMIWSFGGAIQDEEENVVLNSPETIDAVDYMRRLFEGAMTEEVFAWTAASNNQGLIAGQLSYILNSISAYRTAQKDVPETAQDVHFVPALEGPAAALAAQHVMYNWIVPEFSANVDNAKEFLLHYTANFESATFESELYDFPAFADLVPELNDWLAEDPFALEGEATDKLVVLQDSLDWTANVGHRGPASAAIGEVFGTFIVPNMMASAARGEQTPQEAVEAAAGQVEAVFEKWRAEGLVGGGT
ncbi:MAG: extracellular solute-binding protein [Actinobacteria bacterium]|nr:extracellular solute-binding protein [Actinomycetota bacterium]